MKLGFFDLGSGENPNHVSKVKTVKATGCAACGLDKKCKTPKMEVRGSGKSKIMFIVEAPTKTDDENGKLLSGNSKGILEDILSDESISLFSDCWIVPAVRCCPAGTGVDTTSSGNCRSKLLADVAALAPAVIIPLGLFAMQSLIGHRIAGRMSGIQYDSFFGEQIPDQDLGTWVCPTYSLPYLEQTKDSRVIKKQFRDHILQALRLVDVQMPKYGKIPVEIIKTEDKALEFIDWALRQPRVAFDYETTGIKPDRAGHEIVTVSVSDGKTTGAFPYYKSNAFAEKWREFIESPRVGKIAHNNGFENSWSYHFAGSFVRRYIWDTCLAAHCVDNRKPTSLKFLSYCSFGALGYDSEVDEYITATRNGSDSKDGNRFNRIGECPIDLLLYYNGLDSYFSFHLYLQQKTTLQRNPHLLDGFRFFMTGDEALSRVHRTGMRVDLVECKKQFDILTEQMIELDNKIKSSKEAAKYPGGDFKHTSNQQLSTLLYSVLKLQSESKKVDDATLSKLGVPFVEDVLQYRKLKKLRDTYLVGFTREAVDGIIHPFFNLNIATTFRSSSNNPNFQNYPKRDKIAQRIIRSCIVPRKGNKLIEYDYKGVEVSTSASYHKDPKMISYILDKATDMHRDCAMDLFMRTLTDVTKVERQCAKGDFVFPEFYGSTTFNVAPALWENMPGTTKEHLKSKGIKTYEAFYDHVEKIEERFWNKRFSVYRDWKNTMFDQYQKDGFVELHTGFRCWGPMKKTEATNYPIQGAAFHVLLYTLSNVERAIFEISGRSFVIGQIHDAIVVDAHPDDEKEIDRLIKYFGTVKVQQDWPWINVPFEIEKESSQVDGNWFLMTGCGYI